MINVSPDERYDCHALSRDVPETLLLTALLEQGLDPARTQVTKLTGGFLNSNYSVDDGRRRLVFRFYANGAKTAQREIGLLYFLQNHAVAVPRPAGLFELDGRYVGIMEFVDGAPLQERLSSGVSHAADFRRIGGELAKIHRVRFDRCGFFGPQATIGEEFENFPSLARQYMEKVLDDVPAERLEPAIRDRVRKLIAEKWSLVEESEPSSCLVHCDFNPKNLIVSPDLTVRAILDWEFSLAGNGYIDFGNFFRFLFDYPEGAREAFIDGYREVAGTVHPRWFEIARLLDLTNMCAFLERKEDYQKTFRTARWVIDGTLSFFGY